MAIILWAAANLVLAATCFFIGPRYFRNDGGRYFRNDTRYGVALFMLNGLGAVFILPPYVGSNSKYVGVTTDGKTLFLVHEVAGRFHSYVLEPWDLETGKRFTREVPSILGVDPHRIVLRRGNQVWVRSDNGLHIRDLRTAAVVLSHADLVAKVPLLGGATSPASAVGDAICMGSHDGYTLRLDPEAMSATRLPTGTSCWSTPASDAPPAPLVLTTGTRRQVSRRGTESGALLDADHSWLAAEWVLSSHHTQRLDAPESLLMSYQADGSHVPMLARIVVETGHALWTQQTGSNAGAKLEEVVVADDGLVVITSTDLTMLDAATGQLRWSHAY